MMIPKARKPNLHYFPDAAALPPLPMGTPNKRLPGELKCAFSQVARFDVFARWIVEVDNAANIHEHVVGCHSQVTGRASSTPTSNIAGHRATAWPARVSRPAAEHVPAPMSTPPPLVLPPIGLILT